MTMTPVPIKKIDMAAPMKSLSTVQTLLKDFEDKFRSKLVGWMDTERFLSMALSAVISNPDILNCDPTSFLNTLKLCAERRLRPGSDRGIYMVPRRSKRTGKLECSAIVSYKALCDLARRGGILDIKAVIVRPGGKFRWIEGSNPDLQYEPSLTPSTEVLFCYAIAWMDTGRSHFEVLSKHQIDSIRARAPARDAGPWVTDYDEMAKKTAIRRLCKMLPANEDLDEVLAAEDEEEELETLRPVEQTLDVSDTFSAPKLKPPTQVAKAQIAEVHVTGTPAKTAPVTSRRRGRPPKSKPADVPEDNEFANLLEQVSEELVPPEEEAPEPVPESGSEVEPSVEEQLRIQCRELVQAIKETGQWANFPADFEALPRDQLERLRTAYTTRLKSLQQDH